MREFTLEIYELILKSFGIQGYIFSTFEEYIPHNEKKAIILRHDVDRLPNNALQMAVLENKLGINASYYFRIVKESYDENIIKQIADMGHEIGYHYENLSEMSKEQRGNRKQEKENRNEEIGKRKGERGKRKEQIGKSKEELFELAIHDFRLNLEELRKFYAVKTICMHGSPLSKWDNRDLWKTYNYRDFGIIAEPYFDVDFGEVFYITDTGRSWNNSDANIRDRVASHFDIDIKNGLHLIELIIKNKLPDKIMINVHPHRWFENGINWYKELFVQNFKNQIKSLIVRMKNK